MTTRKKGETSSLEGLMRDSHAIEAERPLQPIFRKNERSQRFRRDVR